MLFLCQTEMLGPPAESGNTRPYKILISLLDTWEIGSALTEELILDVLSIADPSVKTVTVDGDEEVGRFNDTPEYGSLCSLAPLTVDPCGCQRP